MRDRHDTPELFGVRAGGFPQDVFNTMERINRRALAEFDVLLAGRVVVVSRRAFRFTPTTMTFEPSVDNRERPREADEGGSGHRTRARPACVMAQEVCDADGGGDGQIDGDDFAESHGVVHQGNGHASAQGATDVCDAQVRARLRQHRSSPASRSE